MKENLWVSAMWVCSQHVLEDAVDRASSPERLFKSFVTLVCLWSLIEAPLEPGVWIGCSRLLFALAPKLLMIVIGVAAIANLRVARQAFTFLCAASVLAIAPALPIEYGRYISIAPLLSTVECISKSACVATFAIMSLRETQPYSR